MDYYYYEFIYHLSNLRQYIDPILFQLAFFDNKRMEFYANITKYRSSTRKYIVVYFALII